MVVKENIRNAWTELLIILRNARETASNLTDPRILGEQLQIIFRDESKLLDKQKTKYNEKRSFTNKFYP